MADSEPLPISDDELKVIDEAIAQMVKTGRDRSITAKKLRHQIVNDDAKLCKQVDQLIAETLTSLKRKVPEDTGEKLHERISKVVDGWADQDEQTTLGVIFYRLVDSMRYMVAYREKFRGLPRQSSISKSDALAELKVRGIGKR